MAEKMGLDREGQKVPLCSAAVVQKVAVLAEILGDPLGQNGVHFRERLGSPPPFGGPPGADLAENFKKRPLSGLVAYQYKGVHFRATLILVGFISETFRETTEYSRR